MQIKRIVILCFLMFTYILGFAHYFIPYCDSAANGCQFVVQHNDSCHNHQHHEHTPDYNIDHEHIQHNGHLDADIYDFIVCFLTDIEHPTKDCDLRYYLIGKTDNNIDIKLVKARLARVLFAYLSIIQQDEELPIYRSEIAGIYLSPSIEHSPHRGPPSTTC